MSRSIYIASAEGDTGKSTIALGITNLLAKQVGRVGIFRPVARTTDGRGDYVLELLLGHDSIDLTYDEAIGVTYDDVHADQEKALTTIVQRFHEVERRCDAVVIVGTDYTDVSATAELEFNGRIAANLGAPVALVVRGHDRTPLEIAQVVDQARTELEGSHAAVAALFVNRAKPSDVEQVEALMPQELIAGVLPEDPILVAPSLKQLMDAVGGQLVSGDATLLTRETRDIIVGAMTTSNLLDRLEDGAVIITPGDRADTLLALLAAHGAEGFPALTGIILSGGFEPRSAVRRLVEGLGSSLPVVRTDMDTFETANRCSLTNGRLSRESQLKVDTALAMFEQRVDAEHLTSILDVAGTDVITPLMFEYGLLDRARARKQHIVLPEGNDDRILRAASSLLTRNVVDLTILGEEAAIRSRAGELGLELDAARVIDPTDPEYVERFAAEYYEMRKHKGATLDAARDRVQDSSYFGTMMVQLGLADGMVSGAVHTTAHTILPSFQIIKTVPGVSVVSSVFFMCLADRVLVYGDCAVNPDPTAEQLADIAISSADTAAQFGVEPRIAMLSYSTGESGTGSDVDKVREATRIVKERRPDLLVDGPMQYDAAVEPSVARSKAPGSPVAGQATVLVFPDLNTGNNTYKAVQRSANAVAVGPVLQGLRKPVNDLSRGALVQDIVNTVAITAIQAQNLDNPEGNA
ncbi:phosphate acetyltransferase [Demequina lignilytica]|uniref:Phosphate acetyltransferase n=1 Tax=Demequina lignilytica TaxID=3051663 RepID=A0AAW7M9W4_9MICO|nr:MULTISPECIES: phosphate acetyltransferase [unclassified Demequina]MDN4478174.1 phosphate acetyltransferase [Demequina sp. SYSU T00039-1]MDN4482747.1 phosphate acetyltransferase [Demequina sp. SYSU T0a273]MDN4488376.1 phosphate acetyltransferase [Demequina sp. SYSU T00039]MDN4490077.1 phosphate acetyltransferase [Demequina sp. SYSU T00068]